MPMSFPNMQSLMNRAEIRGFRQPNENESEDEYRNAFATFMLGVDRVESAEIRSGRGWDQMLSEEVLAGAFGLSPSFFSDRSEQVRTKGEDEPSTHTQD